MRKTIIICLLACLYAGAGNAESAKIWSTEKASRWYGEHSWLVGCNFIPSAAVNQLEMWQEQTFDPATIDRELGWAADIVFNVIRVYLHDLAWKQDKEGLKDRMDHFLSISARHRIQVIFVFFDDCWNPEPREGKQPEPVLGVHNSGWVQSPGKSTLSDPNAWGRLEAYVTDILRRFGDDQRVLFWDLYNEPGNSGNADLSMPLLKKVFEWAWTVRPSQPLSVGVWDKSLTAFNACQTACSDIITFHNYGSADMLRAQILEMKTYNRPLICTEYMARTNGSRFETHLPIFKEFNVGAVNWGLVAGRTNTIFPWWSKEGSTEPLVWFHDIFNGDGTPFDEEEIMFIKEITGR